VRAIVMHHDPSLKALPACAALVLAGFALGSVIWVLSSEKRAKRPPGDAVMRAEMRPTFAMLGLMAIGLGANQTMDPSPDVWAWGLIAVASLAGGLNLGVAFMISAESRPAAYRPGASR
jgi:hypothetical protein